MGVGDDRETSSDFMRRGEREENAIVKVLNFADSRTVHSTFEEKR